MGGQGRNGPRTTFWYFLFLNPSLNILKSLFLACPETKPAPSTVSKDGLGSQGKVMRIPDSTAMPEECGPIFFSGNTDIFQIPDKCCTAEVGAQDLLPLKDYPSYDGVDYCLPFDPFGTPGIPGIKWDPALIPNGVAILTNGCYDDGTQFYGEKCVGSNFGNYSDFAYGDCGPADATIGSCACNRYFVSKTPACIAIGTPQAEPQLALFVKMEGCQAPVEPGRLGKSF